MGYFQPQLQPVQEDASTLSHTADSASARILSLQSGLQGNQMLAVSVRHQKKRQTPNEHLPPGCPQSTRRTTGA